MLPAGLGIGAPDGFDSENPFDYRRLSDPQP
jgi:hypothetical protein